MKSKSKKIVSIILLCVLVVTVSYVYAHIDKNMYLYDRNEDTSTYYGTGILKEGEVVTQTFVSTEDCIDGINIKISMTGDVENVILHYSLVELDTDTVYNEQVNAKDLENNKFNQLTFEGIEGAKGKTYKLILQSENVDEQNGLGFYATHGKEKEQELLIKENPSEGTLVVRIISHEFDFETFIVFMGIVVFIIVFMKVLYTSFK